MIGTDGPMAVVVVKDGIIKTICSLGNATLESQEYDRLHGFVSAKGCSVYLTTVEEPATFPQLYNLVQEAIVPKKVAPRHGDDIARYSVDQIVTVIKDQHPYESDRGVVVSSMATRAGEYVYLLRFSNNDEEMFEEHDLAPL